MFLLVACLFGAVFIPLPYYLLEPGQARPAEPRISVKGAKAFNTDGDVLFTTVTIQQATLATLARGAIDDAIDVESREDVYGDESRQQNQQVNQARMDLSKLVAAKVALNYLGDPAQFTGKGARILGLSKDAPVEGHFRTGDVITEVAGKPVNLPSDISTALGAASPGQTVSVVATRPGASAADGSESASSGSQTIRADVVLGSSADAAPRPILGVSVEPDQPGLDSKVAVSVDSGEVIGPSAGLAWTLGIIDRLTPGSLTGGRKVAVTGEIESDGSVGADRRHRPEGGDREACGGQGLHLSGVHLEGRAEADEAGRRQGAHAEAGVHRGRSGEVPRTAGRDPPELIGRRPSRAPGRDGYEGFRAPEAART